MLDRVRTFFAQRKRSLAVFGGLAIALTLLTAPSAVIHTYSQVLANGEPWNMAFGRAVVTFLALALLWFIHGAMLFAMWSYFVPRLMADARGIKQGIGAAARFCAAGLARHPREFLANSFRIALSKGVVWKNDRSPRLRNWHRMCYRHLVAVEVASDESGDKFAAVATFFSLLMLVGIGYLNWGWATTLHAKLPEWLQSSRPFMGILYIDLFMSMFMWAFIFPIVMTLVRVIVRRIRK